MASLIIEKIVSNIGTRIKTLRTQRKLSLQGLANKAGISTAAIHKIEHSEMTPTITVLMKLADALGKNVSYFIEEDSPDLKDLTFLKNLEHTSFEKRVRISNKDHTIEAEYLAWKLKESDLFSCIYYLSPGVTSGEQMESHPGEEFIYCFEGKIRCRTEEGTFAIKAGDTLHFKGNRPHAWEVIGEIPAKILWVITPPSELNTELWKGSVSRED